MIIVEAGPFNGPDDADASMQWVDITSRVNDNLQAVVAGTGRQTEMDQVNPGPLVLLLNNQDHQVTPGNPSSTYFPGWRTGMRIRVRETIGYQSFTHFDGNMLQPDVTIQTPGLEQAVVVNAIDRIGRVQQSRKFISTLTEYVAHNDDGGSLVGHWPMVEGRGATYAREAAGRKGPLTVEGSVIGAAVGPPELLTFGAAIGPPGEDASYPLFNPILDPLGTVIYVANRLANRSLNLTLSGSYFTVLAWLKLDMTNTGSYDVILLHDNASNTIQLGAQVVWQLLVQTGAGIYTTSGPAPVWGTWQLVGVQLNIATGAVDFWVDGAAFSGTTGGAASGTLDVVVVKAGSPGSSIGQVQIYQGAYTHAQFLAQRDAGYTGMAGQYTGDRIATIAAYAGIAAGDLEIDVGTSRMQRVILANRDPLSVMQEAATTEQGLLHANGRKLIFHDRLRRYNR